MPPNLGSINSHTEWLILQWFQKIRDSLQLQVLQVQLDTSNNRTSYKGKHAVVSIWKTELGSQLQQVFWTPFFVPFFWTWFDLPVTWCNWLCITQLKGCGKNSMARPQTQWSTGRTFCCQKWKRFRSRKITTEVPSDLVLSHLFFWMFSTELQTNPHGIVKAISGTVLSKLMTWVATFGWFIADADSWHG